MLDMSENLTQTISEGLMFHYKPWTLLITFLFTKRNLKSTRSNIVFTTLNYGYIPLIGVLTDSNKAPFNPILPDGVRPKPPTKPAHISDRISP